MTAGNDRASAEVLLRFYEEAGVVSAELDSAGALWTWEEAAERPAPPRAAAQTRPEEPAAPVKPSAMAGDALAEAERIAGSCATLTALCDAIAAFDLCPLKEGARGAVVFDGVLGADILVMGEAPGREEDRQGKPFVGRSGQLLDRMLAAIGLARAPQEDQRPVCISNAIYWRPPGNRTPSKAEIAVCLPFMRRFIELSEPKLVLLAGNVPTRALFSDAPGITRSRGQFRDLALDNGPVVPCLPIFHPAFLLRQPAQKRWAWRDLQAAQAKLNETLT